MHTSHFRKSKIAPTNELTYYVQIQLLCFFSQPDVVCPVGLKSAGVTLCPITLEEVKN